MELAILVLRKRILELQNLNNSFATDLLTKKMEPTSKQFLHAKIEENENAINELEEAIKVLIDAAREA